MSYDMTRKLIMLFISQWFDLYYTEVCPVMLGKKKHIDDEVESEERFFLCSTGNSIYNASNDSERLHKK